MAAESGAKKKKLGEDSIFKLFHSNKTLLSGLKNNISLLENTSSGYGMCLSKIHACDAICDRSFSKATCDTHKFKTEVGGETKEGFALSNIFEHGFQVLESYFDAPYRIPLRLGAKQALAKLLTFLSNDIQDAKKALVGVSADVADTEWSVMVAHHLLSKLSVSPCYMLDKQLYQGKHRNMKCTCGCGEKIDGTYGDTTIGVPKGWHGCIDILMDAAITVPQDESDSPGVEVNQSSVEVGSSANVLETYREQLRAQAIVFSYLQFKNHPEFKNHLIPTIAVSRNQIVICFYDCINDMLLETPPFNLLNREQLSKPAIIILWLTLNYKYFCSGITHAMIDTGYTADFFKLVGKELEQYVNGVKSPYECKASTSQYQLLFSVINSRDRKIEDVNCINEDPNIF